MFQVHVDAIGKYGESEGGGGKRKARYHLNILNFHLYAIEINKCSSVTLRHATIIAIDLWCLAHYVIVMN